MIREKPSLSDPPKGILTNAKDFLSYLAGITGCVASFLYSLPTFLRKNKELRLVEESRRNAGLPSIVNSLSRAQRIGGEIGFLVGAGIKVAEVCLYWYCIQNNYPEIAVAIPSALIAADIGYELYRR